ncbi:MAG TPA: hypothetical protein VEH29_10590, partial [Acidimicrobiales bacterium]|nr:hypothetical protein [Acidimicrobiales bacterium]
AAIASSAMRTARSRSSGGYLFWDTWVTDMLHPHFQGIEPPRIPGRIIAALQALLGRPNATGINTACGSSCSEVAWHDLIAEFKFGTFTGYRFVRGGYPLTTPGSPHDPVAPTSTTPALSTARGITLGSTLKELRAAYPKLVRSGALKWKAPNGLTFVEAHNTKNPLSPTARIVEIKIGTCGDF